MVTFSKTENYYQVFVWLLCVSVDRRYMYVRNNVIEHSRIFWNVLSRHVYDDLKDYSRLYVLIISLQTLHLVFASNG